MRGGRECPSSCAVAKVGKIFAIINRTVETLKEIIKNDCLSIERSGSGVELRTLDYENLGSNPVLRC